MWATAEQTSQEIIDLYRYAAAHADATIQALPLGAAGEVPGWPPQRRRVSLHQILTHVCVETARHAGHADILREVIDNTAGRRPGDPSLPGLSAEQWAAYRDRIEAAAQQASRARTDAQAVGVGATAAERLCTPTRARQPRGGCCVRQCPWSEGQIAVLVGGRKRLGVPCQKIARSSRARVAATKSNERSRWSSLR